MQEVFHKGKLIKFAEACWGLVRRVIPEYSSKYSRKDFTQQQLAVLACLMKKYKSKYRDFIELIEPMDRLKNFLGLKKIPHFTTLNKFFLKMENAVLSVLLQLSVGESSGVASVDATGFDRRHASKQYLNRCRMHIKSMKTTFLIDTKNQNILDVHCTTTRKHDSKIVLPLTEHHRLKILCADMGL